MVNTITTNLLGLLVYDSEDRGGPNNEVNLTPYEIVGLYLDREDDTGPLIPFAIVIGADDKFWQAPLKRFKPSKSGRK